jgi:uncharacterized membrane protein
MWILGGIWHWLADASLLDWTVRLIFVAAVPQTLFVVGFGLRNTWWTSLLGWGQFTKALAVDLILLMTVFEELLHWTPQTWVSFVIVVLILIGATLQCAAWVAEKRHQSRGGEPTGLNPDLYA